MAAKRKTRAREAQLAFEALSIEGGLLSPEWLSKVAQLQAGTQAEADYRIHKGLNLRDEIGRYWRIAQAHWADFKSGRIAKADPKAISERFVLALLRDAFGFSSLAKVEPVVLAERMYPIGQAALGGRVPVVVAPADSGLDAITSLFGDGSRRRSAFGLAQEYLNAQEGALWGIASDGASLRIVRDNASLTRPAWIEADIQRIFAEERYADFAALWLLCHETRFGREGQPVTECALEAWRNAGREEGTRAREHLRRGVEDALVALGQGFLSHADNQSLRVDLQNGTLPAKDYFNQLLRLVYRLIFLLTVEERGLLHPEGASDAAKALYASGYGIRRLRERSVKRSAHDRFSDLWEATKVVCRGLAAGEPRLGLPALAGIFAMNQCPALDASKLENRALLLAMFKLAWLREGGSLARVNWRDMGPEELGSVYESLLELVPQITKDGRQFAFATGGEARGNARKTTGSYYTPDSLVQVLLDSALEPVIASAMAKNPANPIEALLGLSIVDPACGSGHFLLAAARRLAAHVARLQANGTPSAAEYRHALRQVVGRCIFGVDLNPMAVELCKVSLWMEAVEPGLPLTFLNSHIQRGNALLGTTPELMAKGIPDAAWDPIEGDDKKIASALKKRNKKHAAEEQTEMPFIASPAVQESQSVTRAILDLDAESDTSVEALAKKEERWDGILGSHEYRHQKFVADAWCAAFVWPKQSGDFTDAAPTNELWRQLRDGQGQAPALTTKTVGELAEQYRFFHWHLQFPQVLATGGFDVVLGNPPWERISLKEKEWFAQRDPEVAKAETGALRLKRIAELERTNPELYRGFVSAKQVAAGEKNLLRRSGAFPLCGQGDVNTFAVFAELGKRLSRGRSGLVLPTGIVSTETTQDFVAELVKAEQLVSVFDFDNRAGIFPAVQGNVRFCLLVISRGQSSVIHAAAQLRSTAELSNSQKTWRLTQTDIRRINPNTLTMPLFPSGQDAELVAGIYSRLRCLDESGADYPGRWNVPMQRMLHMGDDSHLFKTDDQLGDYGYDRQGETWVKGNERYIALLEAKLCHQYDHRAGTFDGIPKTARFGTHPATREVTAEEHAEPTTFAEPRYWVPESEVRARIGARRFLLSFRDAVSAVADSRSLVAAIVPPYGAGDTLKFLFPDSAREAAFICAWFNSFATDFVFRLKASGAHASFFLLRQLPMPRRDVVTSEAPWAKSATVLEWVVPRVIELTYTSHSVSGFAVECGFEGPPFRWNAERRSLLAAELDAAVFHLYGLSRKDVQYVLETFQIVRRSEEKAYGSYRTRDTILDIYDAMIEANRTNSTYQTRLNPPAADASFAHSDRGGKVTSLRPATHPQPEVGPAAAAVALIPDLAVVGTNAWVRSRSFERGEIQAAILAVLKAHGGPMNRQQARLATLLCLEPHLLILQIDGAERAQWVRVIGGDAQKAPTASIDSTTREWGAALTGLRGRERLLEDLQQDTWALGSGTDAIDTNGWPDGRAGFVVNVLRRLYASTAVDEIINNMPTNAQQWINHAA